MGMPVARSRVLGSVLPMLGSVTELQPCMLGATLAHEGEQPCGAVQSEALRGVLPCLVMRSRHLHDYPGT